MTERTKYILLIIKTYLKTQNSLASEPTEPLIKDLQAELLKHELLKKQKYIEQKTNITKEEFLLKCELAAIDLKEYGYMQYSIAVNTLKYEELIPDQSESEEDQFKFIDKQIKFYLVDLSGLDPSIKYALYNLEIEFIKEIIENINQSSSQSTQIEKIEPNALSSNVTNKNTVPIPELFGEVFCNNGFELFEHILNKYVSPLNKRGRKSDLIFYYWALYYSKPQYIHKRPTQFFIWFEEKYNEMPGQLKTYEDLKKKDSRVRDFSLALEWFKSK